jgi:hypothetical protein
MLYSGRYMWAARLATLMSLQTCGGCLANCFRWLRDESVIATGTVKKCKCWPSMGIEMTGQLYREIPKIEPWARAPYRNRHNLAFDHSYVCDLRNTWIVHGAEQASEKVDARVDPTLLGPIFDADLPPEHDAYRG